MEAAFSLVGWTPRFLLVAALLSGWALWRYRRGTLAPRHAQWAMTGLLVFDVLLAARPRHPHHRATLAGA